MSPPAWLQVDWSAPWLAPWRLRGESLARQVGERGLVAALNQAVAEPADVRCELAAGSLTFVPAEELPRGEAYEAFIARTACVPTRSNLHDFFNALMWLSWPRLKRHLNELQAEHIAAGAGGKPHGPSRGAVRDALTLFDENAALWQAPPVLFDALQRRDWHGLFVTHRSDWVGARPVLFGHALLEKLAQPRKAITAHVWVLPQGADAEAAAVTSMSASVLATKPFMPMPVLGVPGWWPANEAPGFYADASVFRVARRAGPNPMHQ